MAKPIPGMPVAYHGKDSVRFVFIVVRNGNPLGRVRFIVRFHWSQLMLNVTQGNPLG